MTPGPAELAAFLIAVSFAAGLNAYATIATLGVLARTGLITLPPALGLLDDTWVIAVSAVLFAAEFIADKIPLFDLVWNALHTVVRIPVAGLVAYAAAAPLPPGQQLLAAVLGAAVAAIAHGGKTAARAAVTASPEPVSNSVLSVGEDVVAIGLTWFATAHPFIAGAIALAFIISMALAVRWVWRWMTRPAKARRAY
jgi:hypothetical protein